MIRFGPQFLGRHAPRITGAPTALIRADDQYIYVRAGETDTAAVRSIFGAQQYNISGVIPELDQRINARYESIVQSGRRPVIVDAGANIGAASLWFKNRYPASAVVAIEPEPGNFGVLSKNAGFKDRLVAIQAAIGSEDGFVAVKDGPLGWATRVERASQGLPIITMDRAFETVENGVPFIAKIDIEGLEKDLFSKNTGWLADTFVVHIELHD